MNVRNAISGNTMSRSLIVAMLACVLALAVPSTVAAAPRAFSGGSVPEQGIAVLIWGGGSVTHMSAAAGEGGCNATAVWTVSDGVLSGYRFGAPSFVNGAFLGLHSGGWVAAGTLVIVTCDGPVASPDTAAASCDDWPERVAEVLAVLQVPDGLCFQRLLTATGEGAAGEYRAGDRLAVYRWAPPTGGEVGVVTHEACHAHQHWHLLRQGMGDHLNNWIDTDEGQAFVAASDAALARAGTVTPIAADPWGSAPLEDFAQVCNLWFNPQIYGSFFFDSYPELQAFAAAWLAGTVPGE